MEMTDLEFQVLFEIQKAPRLSATEICRRLNGRWKYYCGRRSCFANGRKRRNLGIQPCVCGVHKRTVWNLLQGLKKKGLVVSRREKKADDQNNRGWDWFNVYYSTLMIAFGGDMLIRRETDETCDLLSFM